MHQALKNLGPRKRLTGPARVEAAAYLKKRYDAGESIRDLVAATGRSYGFISRMLDDAGTTIRARGGHGKKASAGAGGK